MISLFVTFIYFVFYNIFYSYIICIPIGAIRPIFLGVPTQKVKGSQIAGNEIVTYFDKYTIYNKMF
jgi:hypothetical protein